MALEDHWPPLGDAEMEGFAQNWIDNLENPKAGDSGGQSVVMMGFMAPPEQQWSFIVAAVSLARTDDQLGHIAAGPVECLLSQNGNEYIGLVEEQAQTNHAFARMLTGVWQHSMSDEVWRRVQALQAVVEDPIKVIDRG